MENVKVSSLDHVRWVGGGSGAGKTTVTRLLAGRFDLTQYSSDATISDHSNRLGPLEAPLLEQFRRMRLDERWVERDPMTMWATFPWFQGEGFDLVLDDLRGMPTDQPLLVEGFRLIPHLVRPYLSNPERAVWLVPTPDFRRAAMSRRHDAAAFWMRTSDPDRAFANVLERDRINSDSIVRDCEECELEVFYVDGTQSIDDVVGLLGLRFGLA